jgi:hypothetical protein
MMTNLILIRFITIMKKIFFISAAIVLAASCNKNIIGMSPVEECGYIDLGVTAETEMVITRGLVTEADLSGYNITLVKDNKVVEDGQRNSSRSMMLTGKFLQEPIR